MTALRVLSPGLHTTVQDLGRFGAQHLGIPVSGALDPINLRFANLLVGNDEAAGAFEMIAHGASFEVLSESARLAVAGPDTQLKLIRGTEPKKIVPYESFTLEKGDQFGVTVGEASSVCYLAVEGGLELPRPMGSQSTFVRAEMGGFKGRKLLAGDEIPLNEDRVESRAELALPIPDFPQDRTFRIMLGPQDDYFDEEMIASFLSTRFTISHQSDRMGFRLSGFTLQHSKDFNIVSDGIAPGAIQVPGSGEPIILLADRQTTGGYPKIGTVISADLPALGRLRPGQDLLFRAVDFDEARKAAHDLHAWFLQAKTSIAETAGRPAVNVSALFEQNLIGGVISAKVSLAD